MESNDPGVIEFKRLISEEAPVESLLTQQFCVFLDVLGFSAYVKNGKGDEAAFLTIVESLKHARATLSLGEEKKLIKVKSFSDNIVIAVKCTGQSEHLGFFLEFISGYQMAMIEHGFFCRGGLSVGDLVIDDNYIYGHALLEAYELESTKAINPMVLMSNEVIERARESQHFHVVSSIMDKQGIGYFIRIDGLYYLNYLRRCFIHYQNRDEELDCYLDYRLLDKHKQHIHQNLADQAIGSSIYKKYAFLARYHNEFVSRCTKYDGYHDRFIIHTIDEIVFVNKDRFRDGWD
ncbi:hypothetical protein [Pseudomonas huaxiensis]|uniref:hypothetical protein n=1 Tax=Pseudomonas huaxiensis TaxID=2213017 RepID=UPI000DA660AE|nr:hypothetical protein [Pseudomonas huaxiensis]